MLLPLPLLGLIASFLLPTAVRASALTTAISANERLCFYADADKAGEKIGVSLHVEKLIPGEASDRSCLFTPHLRPTHLNADV